MTFVLVGCLAASGGLVGYSLATASPAWSQQPKKKPATKAESDEGAEAGVAAKKPPEFEACANGTKEQKLKACAAIAGNASHSAAIRAEAYHQLAYEKAYTYGDDALQVQSLADIAKAVELAPNDIKYLTFQAERNAQTVYENGGRRVVDAAKAEAAFTKAITLAAKAPKKEALANLHHQRGELYAELKANDKALADFNAALELGPDGYQATTVLAARARLYIEGMNQTSLGLADLRKAAVMSPRYHGRELVDASIKMGRIVEVVGELKELVGQAKKGDDRADLLALRGMMQVRLDACGPAQADLSAALEAVRRTIDTRETRTELLLARGHCRWAFGQLEDALADFDEAIALKPKGGIAEFWRARLLSAMGEADKAKAAFEAAAEGLTAKSASSNFVRVADTTQLLWRAEAMWRAGRSAEALVLLDDAIARAKYDWEREPLAVAKLQLMLDGQPEKAIALSRGIARSGETAVMARLLRGEANRMLGRPALASADIDEALTTDEAPYSYAQLLRAESLLDAGKPQFARDIMAETLKRFPGATDAMIIEARARLALGDTAGATERLTAAVRLAPQPAAYYWRAQVHEAAGDTQRAIGDYRAALSIAHPRRLPDYVGYPSTNSPSALADWWEQRAIAKAASARVDAARKLASLDGGAAAAAEPVGRRVALVIGNSAYDKVPRLPNPARDATALASALKRLGFAEVVEKKDLGLRDMIRALKEFAELSTDADWAVIYYAGHAMELDGTNYLLPVDAVLAQASHAEDEAIPLDRVLSRVEGARALRLVILDACRDNPFATTMKAAGATRSINRGLARIDPAKGVIVAYAARDGQTADDGDAANSPYATALLENIERPGVELGQLLRRVRDRVLTLTANRQEPFFYGSLPSTRYYFKPPQ